MTDFSIIFAEKRRIFHEHSECCFPEFMQKIYLKNENQLGGGEFSENIVQ